LYRVMQTVNAAVVAVVGAVMDDERYPGN
jgi:hypothetical protein